MRLANDTKLFAAMALVVLVIVTMGYIYAYQNEITTFPTLVDLDKLKNDILKESNPFILTDLLRNFEENLRMIGYDERILENLNTAIKDLESAYERGSYEGLQIAMYKAKYVVQKIDISEGAIYAAYKSKYSPSSCEMLAFYIYFNRYLFLILSAGFIAFSIIAAVEDIRESSTRDKRSETKLNETTER